MPTVISEEKGFAFLHVPKTGGTTFGQQIAEQVPYDGRFYEGVERDEELGEFFQDHLTMQMYAKHYPDVLTKLRQIEVFAIGRDPYARFRSALAEYSRLNELGELSQLSPEALSAFIADVIEKLESGDSKSLKMIFFRPQSEFLSLNGEMIARHIFGIDALDRFAENMSARYGIRIDTRENRRETPQYNRALFARIAPLKRIASRLLPAPALDRVKRLVKRLLRTKGDPALDEILTRLDVRGFVRRYYKTDYDILEAHGIRAL